ncbi:hypothetical protein GCM10023116_38530 [Kistimonas scapharcae]|uniref:DUF4365 domain-containing protein n=2 Tax=Kistimonas scapharcae TaxID=1036133 RepID=A0ABP8V825_9GAMM
MPNHSLPARSLLEVAFDDFCHDMSDDHVLVKVKDSDNGRKWGFQVKSTRNDPQNLVSLAEVYRHFVTKKSLGQAPVTLGQRLTEVSPSNDLRLACAFVLSSESNFWCFREHQGRLYLESKDQGLVSAKQLKAIQYWHSEATIDEIFYQFQLENKTLPKGFIHHLLKRYMRGEWNNLKEKYNTSRRGIPRRDSFGGNQPAMPSCSQGPQSAPVSPVSPSSDQAQREALIADLLNQFNIDTQDEASLTPLKCMHLKRALKQAFLSEYGVEDPLTAIEAHSARSLQLPSTPEDSPTGHGDEEVSPITVDTRAELDPKYQAYLDKVAARQTLTRRQRFHRFMRRVVQWFARNKRGLLLNIVDMVVSSLAGILLTGTFIAAPIYVLAALGTLVFWFALDSLVLYVRKRWNQSKVEQLRTHIADKEGNISHYNTLIEHLNDLLMRIEEEAPELLEEFEAHIQTHKEELAAIEEELKQHQRELLDRLLFLAGEVHVTDALIVERRELDRLAEKADCLKLTAGDSVEAANNYQKALAAMKQQENRLADSMEPVTEAVIQAQERYTQEKAIIEEELQALLGPELNIFGSMSEDALGQAFTRAIEQRGELEAPSLARKVWSFIYKPRFTADVVGQYFQACDSDEWIMLGRVSDEVRELKPEAYMMVSGENAAEAKNKLQPEQSIRMQEIDLAYEQREPCDEVGEPNNGVRKKYFYIVEKRGDKEYTLNANLLLADQMVKAQAGIRMDQVVNVQADRLHRGELLRGLKTCWDTFIGYFSYYVRRIPFRLHESGVTWALMSGARLSFVSVLTDAFPNPGAAGGFGIALWLWIRYLANKLESKNNQVNQRIAATRERMMHAYQPPEMKIPDWMEKLPPSRSTGVGRKLEKIGYFNAGVLDNSVSAQLSEDEWRALRRQAKHASGELMPLVNALEEVKVQLKDVGRSVRSLNGGDVPRELQDRAACLLLRYSLLTRRIEDVNKTLQQANDECVRHVHLANKRVKLLYPDQQRQPAMVQVAV